MSNGQQPDKPQNQSLLDELVAAGRLLPPSHLPSLADLSHVIGALVAHFQHGDEFLSVARKGVNDVAALLGGDAHGQGVTDDRGTVIAPAAALPDQAPAGATGTATTAPEAGQPAQAPAATAAPAAPDADDATVAELVAQVQSLQAQLADQQRATVTSSSPTASPAPDGAPPAPTTGASESAAAATPPPSDEQAHVAQAQQVPAGEPGSLA